MISSCPACPATVTAYQSPDSPTHSSSVPAGMVVMTGLESLGSSLTAVSSTTMRTCWAPASTGAPATTASNATAAALEAAKLNRFPLSTCQFPPAPSRRPIAERVVD